MLNAAQPEELRFIRLENKQGKAYAIATNQTLAIIEYLGPTNEADGAIHLVPDQALLDQCTRELAFNSSLEVSFIKSFGIHAIHSMLGYSAPTPNITDPAHDSPLNGWARWVPAELPKFGRGRFQVDAAQFAMLAQCCPSGIIVFPSFLNTWVTMVMRDAHTDTWMGLLKGDEWPGKQGNTWDVLPDWWAC